MTDVIKEEVDINETFDSTRKMVHGEPPKGTIAYDRKYGKYTAKGYLRKRPNPNKPPEQVAEVLTKSMGQFIKDFIKSKNPEAVDEVTMRRTIPTKQERLARNKYYANHNIALSAEKRRAGIENYPGREDPIIGNLKGAFKKNLEKDKAANEEVSLDEGRGRPPKPGSAAWKKRQSEGGGDSDTPGLHGQLIKHKHLQNAPPEIKFTNGEKAHVSAEHRDRAIKHLEGMIGPGKDPEARKNAINAMSHSHAGFKQAIGVEPKETKSPNPMSAQKAPPTLSLTKEESKMAQEDIVEKLQAALDAGILSQNDFDKLTQIDELRHLNPNSNKLGGSVHDTMPSRPPGRPKPPAVKRGGDRFPGYSHSVKEDSEQLAESPDQWRYSGSVGRSANTNTHKNYTLDIPGDSELGDYHDDDLHDMISEQNPHLEHHEVSAIVNSAGDPKSKQKVEHAGKKYTHHVVNHQEPERLYDEVNYTGNPIAEKALVGKQKILDKNRNGKLDAQDFKMIRKEETTAGVAAVVAALSRNLKELK